MKNAKQQWMQRIQLKGLCIGLIASVLVMIVIAAIGATLINRGTFREEQLNIFSVGAMLIASLIGSVVSSAGKGNGSLIQILLFLIVLVLIMTIINISFFDGRFSRVLPCLLGVVIGGAIAVLIKAGTRHSGGIKKIRIS